MQRTFCQRLSLKILRGLRPYLSDRLYLQLVFRVRMGYKLNLDEPATYSEKLQWLKLNDRHLEYSDYVDKIRVKEYVASKIGESHIIPTLGVYNSVEEIDFSTMPNRWVLKTSHDSGGVFICKDNSSVSATQIYNAIGKNWMNNYFKYNLEYPYANVTPRLLVEAYIEDESEYELKDYKFFCFNGEPKFLFVATDRSAKCETKFDFFDLDWNHLPIINGHPNSLKELSKPDNFDEMINIAKILSRGFRHVRVDLYNVKGKIYFGELTFFHFSGMEPFEPIDWDYKLGEYLEIHR